MPARFRRLTALAFVFGSASLVACGGSSGNTDDLGDAAGDGDNDGSSGDGSGDDTNVFVLDTAPNGETTPQETSIDCDANPSLCPGVCGDGLPGPGESCDDGNTTSGDGCSSVCQIEAPYWACVWGQPCVDARNCDQLLEAGIVDSGCVSPPPPPICGDGILEAGEACDDKNTVGGDGCAADCSTVEANFICATPGAPCVSTMVCGDGRIEGTEQCDDKNTKPGDGCGATCQLEPGWTCPVVGVICSASKCGDGIVAGSEQCDDGNIKDGDGCSATCQLQRVITTVTPTTTVQGSTTVTNYNCSYPATPTVPPHETCAPTTCGTGSGKVEGTEECDDGNNVPFDGCSPDCQLEPKCPNGACVAQCGDGILFDFDANGDGKPDEQCDDGNNVSGDGCSSTCTIESGYTCATTTAAFPTFIDAPIVVRDFKYWNATDNTSHPDYERYGCTQQTIDLALPTLSANKVPVFQWNGLGNDPITGTNNACGQQLTSALDFTDWYQDINVTVGGVSVRRSKKISNVQIRLTRNGAAGNFSYVFDSGADQPYATKGGFFPIDTLGWGDQSNGHNFSFSTEFRYWFTYDKTVSPTLTFSGDDDLWVYVNDKIALDLGGLHPPVTGSFVLDPAKAATLGLVDQHVYEIALFNAERHTAGSNFKLTLRGFAKRESVCSPVCGDAIQTPTEQCDLGTANVNPATGTVPYGGCTNVCTLGPFCGDKKVTTPPEDCDDGINLTSYAASPASTACAPGCKKPADCGDGQVQTTFGEQCDNGPLNTDDPNAYDACSTKCVRGPRCGDAVVQASFGEVCDDGFNVTTYVTSITSGQCAPGCKLPAFCGDGVQQIPEEQCDNGATNTDDGSYNSCTKSCLLGPRCGDGIVNGGEQCDDGNRVNGDGCSASCLKEGPR